MKAKDYQKTYTNMLTSGKERTDAIIDILHQFIEESQNIAIGRGNDDNACMIGALKTQSEKWRAFCRLIDAPIFSRTFYNAIIQATTDNPYGEQMKREYIRYGFVR